MYGCEVCKNWESRDEKTKLINIKRTMKSERSNDESECDASCCQNLRTCAIGEPVPGRC